jgi:hypothetical protein
MAIAQVCEARQEQVSALPGGEAGRRSLERLNRIRVGDWFRACEVSQARGVVSATFMFMVTRRR